MVGVTRFELVASSVSVDATIRNYTQLSTAISFLAVFLLYTHAFYAYTCVDSSALFFVMKHVH